MAKARKDERGRALRKGEVQRASDKRYMYTYTDPLGRRKFIYANDLTTLREKEKQLMKDQLDGLDVYVAGKATVNDTFDRYMSTKCKLRETTRSNYIYIYHIWLQDENGIQAYARILPQGMTFSDFSIGRVISVKRRCGIGSKIVAAAIDVAKDKFRAKRITIEAQVYVRRMYEKIGFHQTSEEFLEDGIPHIQMQLDC